MILLVRGLIILIIICVLSIAGYIIFGLSTQSDAQSEPIHIIKQVLGGDREPTYVTQYSIDEATLSGKHVVARLDGMQIDLVEDGAVLDSMPILSKGKPGSAWETPAGQYEIKTKIFNHFSSIGEVYMPYSMQFYGNFFIHGWPYYPNGTPVDEGYSGGCIRLATEDAERIYNFVTKGVPVHVISNTEIVLDNDFQYQMRSYVMPDVSAPSYMVTDLDTGEIIMQKNASTVRPIASLTKLVTALVSLEILNQFQTATVSSTAVGTYGQAGNLRVGQKLEVKELLYPLLLTSSNDASEVLAEHLNRHYFMESMNDKVRSIGLKNTQFDDPSGLSAKNVSTATDLSQLMNYLWNNKKYVLDLTTVKNYKGKDQLWSNNSRFDEDVNYLGGKNGYIDESRHTLITAHSLSLAEFENRNIAIVLLGSENKEEDARALLSFLNDTVYYAPHSENVPAVALSAE
jgi:hypothetical protein